MVVVSDTSIITNLIHLDHLLLLNHIFGEITIPVGVFEELQKKLISGTDNYTRRLDIRKRSI